MRRAIEKTRGTPRCHDCGAMPGELHKTGCDTERCAMCGGQFIACDCVYEVNEMHPEPGNSGL